MKNNLDTLVTGGRGLVGSSLSGDINRVGSEFDLRDKAVTDKLFSDLSPKNVIHCAARVGGLGGNMNHKGEFFYDNIMMNTNVIESCRIHNVKKLVCFLSTCVFPSDVEYPLTEKKIHLGPPHNTNDSYSYAKRMAEVQIRAYREQYGLNYVTVIPTNIYGPNDNFDLDNGHVVPSLIHKCYLAKKNNTPFKIWGSGKPLREFIFSKDVAKLTEWVLDNYESDEPLILSTSEEVSIKDVVNLIVKHMSFTGEIIWESDKPDGQFRKPSDNSKLLSHLPEFKFTSLDDGLKETIEWFVKNYENCRK
ncbi:MAG: GDP-fucose synthetase [Flavobacteriales bacterium]|jgi:GDP-L-fucose synthase|nr:GDP-fucose synthetase [Flavobacteriales bacterium]|tara:strand:+ start:11523 stop:12437 length:915 start_codon:yes stop_codon:yes gene_type:complete